jgi:predicted nucleic acid-binding protein
VRVPVTVLGEATYLMGSRLGPPVEEGFVRGIVAGEFILEALEEDDLERAADLMRAYVDLPLGFVDASIVALAERLGGTTVLTTDRRHFGIVRPSHCERLRLVP